MILLVDIGNTRLKWCVEQNGMNGEMNAIEYKFSQFPTDMKTSWSSLKRPQLLAISTVTAEETSLQIIEIAKQLWAGIEIFIAQTSRSSLAVNNAYQDAKKLGVDRWLGMIALQHYFTGNKCIIDCGTAITLDCIDNNGQHSGGVICPGLQLMKLSLCKGTERLSMPHQSDSLGLADTTDVGIATGVLYSAVGFIEKTINSLPACDVVVLTGGDAPLLARYVVFKTTRIKIEIQPDFVLKGLALLCKEQRTL